MGAFRRTGQWARLAFVCVLIGCAVLALATVTSMRDLPQDLNRHTLIVSKRSFVDRYAKPLNVTFLNRWNLNDRIRLHDVPLLLQHAFVVSEDKRFFEHSGIDWRARSNAVWQNLCARETVRGASTISEQIVKMLNPRPRTVWTRWIEGFEAKVLERNHDKLALLEFYLNQVPYGARRRGVVQAARYYFGRDIDTLNEKEMLALAIMVRSPRWFDPKRKAENLARAIHDLASRLDDTDLLGVSLQRFAALSLETKVELDEFNVAHFVAFAATRTSTSSPANGVHHTTIDLELQHKVQQMLDRRLRHLAPRDVSNGAVLIVDHESNEVRAWVVGHAGAKNRAFNELNAILRKRQPGSALKPLLYSKAIEQGWTAATLIDDAPLDGAVGLGLHTYHNYSRTHYGPVSVREALGNSLNIPAIKAIRFVGEDIFLNSLRELGIESLTSHPNTYGDGLALGNGELSLYELVQAYTVLARMGDFKPLSVLDSEHTKSENYRIFSEDIASLVADILSDDKAREKEFGRHSLLNFSHQTAVKTGTSNDYRDAWALGFNDKFTIGVWMGNMDYTPMQEITGASGPALVLRAVFNELNRNREVRGLYLSENLVKRAVCIDSELSVAERCESRDEWFIRGTSPRSLAADHRNIRLTKPSRGLQLALDPRIPDEHEYFEFSVDERTDIRRVKWFVNDQLVATTTTPTYAWKLERGDFTARAEVTLVREKTPVTTDVASYRVN